MSDIESGHRDTFESHAAWARSLAERAGVTLQFAWRRSYTILSKMGEPKHEKPITEKPKEEKPAPHDAVLAALRKSRGHFISIQDLALSSGLTVHDVHDGIKEARSQGFNIHVNAGSVGLSAEIPKAEATVIRVSDHINSTHRCGLISDNHLGSRYARLDVLNALYDYFEEQGITTVYNCGNWIEGDARFNKHDVVVHGLEGQIRYFLDNYPAREGITTYFITGDDHEGWYTQREGIDVGAYMQMRAREAGRDDLVYLGHMEHDIIFEAPKGNTVIRLQHPGGGSAYAISYAPQKIVESLQGGEKPHILFIGHYHKASYDHIRGIHVVQAGCTQDQSPFMRKKRLAAHLGGWIVEWSADDVGAISRFVTEWIPFYNRDFYKGVPWRYMMQPHETIG